MLRIGLEVNRCSFQIHPRSLERVTTGRRTDLVVLPSAVNKRSYCCRFRRENGLVISVFKSGVDFNGDRRISVRIAVVSA